MDEKQNLPEPSGEDTLGLARHLRQHLESLRAAGVYWLPASGEPAALAAGLGAAPVLTAHATGKPIPYPAAGAAGSPAQGNIEQRRHELAVLAERVSGCRLCSELVVSRSRTVFGIGPIDAELCFIGEGPGQNEDRRGEPFVGEAGQLLDRIIAACGMKREEVYICNIVKCRPPGNRTPTAEEAGHCRQYLERQLELVQPRFLCALGACAAQNLLGTSQSIGKLRGRFHDYKGIPVMCTYHPAYLLRGRNPQSKREVWEDMKKLLERMGRPVPGR